MQLIVIALGLLGSSVWLAHLLHLIRHRRVVAYLADVPPVEPPGGWPRVAIVIAARDEAASIDAAARSILRQDYPGLAVIAVDDRSTDGTRAILAGIAREDPRLQLVAIDELPDGWLGKTHALQTGAGAADAEWILFTDADVVFVPEALRHSLAYAVRERADHVAAVPEITSATVGERIFLAMFGLMFSMYARPGRISDAGSRAHAGVGAFNLVRAEPFHAIGGFRRLALSVDDDVRLGQAMKFAGYASRFVLARGLVAVRWQVGLGGMIRGVEKNFFAGLGYRLGRVAVVLAGLATLGIAPFAGLFVGPAWTRAACAVGVASIALILTASRRGSGIGPAYALTMPLAAVAIMVALVRSVALTLARGGVVWRDHLYPLDALRAHVRLRDAWIREVWRSTR